MLSCDIYRIFKSIILSVFFLISLVFDQFDLPDKIDVLIIAYLNVSLIDAIQAMTLVCSFFIYKYLNREQNTWNLLPKERSMLKYKKFSCF